jgi:hypothetical protein
MGDAVVIRGLREFQAGLRQVDPRLTVALRRAHKTIAEDVASQSRRQASSLGGGFVRLTRSGVIGSRASNRSASVALNSGRVPDAFGHEFGAWAYKQFRGWRGNAWNQDADDGPGYVIHPTIRRLRPRIADEYADRVLSAFAKAFPE